VLDIFSPSSGGLGAYGVDLQEEDLGSSESQRMALEPSPFMV